MSNLTLEQKQKAKAAAANAAVAANDTAVVLGAAGVVAAAAGGISGAGAPAGLMVGAVLGVASFGAWFMANRYQRLANDPPRDDYANQTLSTAAYVENQSFDEPVYTMRGLSGEYLVFADAMTALVLSIERYDGAVGAQDSDAAALQAEAVQKNAAASSASLRRIKTFAAVLNDNWSTYASQLDWSNATVESAQKLITANCGSDSTSPEGGLADLLTRVTGIDAATLFLELNGDQHPLFQISSLPRAPDMLFGDDWLKAVEAAIVSLDGLGGEVLNT
ncbi:hypothetical protein G3N57_01800 [Paraburkholderia sp. Se-20369]|nr:hypothetical protein [Paraburkholderia sp. Se-20369]